MIPNLRVLFKDLKEYTIRSPSDEREVTLYVLGQINKWLEDNGRSRIINSILMNKLVYYISKEVQKSNPGFKIDSGWYIYGPCYLEGMNVESDTRVITISTISDDFSEEVATVCSELVPKFEEAERDSRVMSDFLMYIYKEKCDESSFQNYYVNKQELLCSLFNLKDGILRFEDDTLDSIYENILNFENIFYKDQYPSLVELSQDEIDNIIEFTGIMGEYIENQYSIPKDGQILDSVFNTFNNRVLKGLSKLNFGETFTSRNTRHENNVKTKFSNTGHKMIQEVNDDNKYLGKSVVEMIM